MEREICECDKKILVAKKKLRAKDFIPQQQIFYAIIYKLHILQSKPPQRYCTSTIYSNNHKFSGLILYKKLDFSLAKGYISH